MKHSDVNRLFTAAKRLNSAANWLTGIKSEDEDVKSRLNKFIDGITKIEKAIFKWYKEENE